jgi:hypothetical protein
MEKCPWEAEQRRTRISPPDEYFLLTKVGFRRCTISATHHSSALLPPSPSLRHRHAAFSAVLRRAPPCSAVSAFPPFVNSLPVSPPSPPSPPSSRRLILVRTITVEMSIPLKILVPVKRVLDYAVRFTFSKQHQRPPRTSSSALLPR